MNIIPVLKLDDDNHSPCYVTRNGHWSDADRFMRELLCKPHTVEYKIKEISLIYLDLTLTHESMSVEEMFDRVDNYQININDHRVFKLTDEGMKKREIAFDFFWNTDEEVLYARSK